MQGIFISWVIVSLSKQTCLMLRALISDWSQWELEPFIASLIHRKPSFLHGNLWGHNYFSLLTLSLHLCHAHIISVGWTNSLKKEGKKSQEHCGLADDFGFSTSLCKCQVIHKWFSKCCLWWNQIKGSSRRHTKCMKPEPVLGLQGFWCMPTSQGPALSPGELPMFHKISAMVWLCSSSLGWV